MRVAQNLELLSLQPERRARLASQVSANALSWVDEQSNLCRCARTQLAGQHHVVHFAAAVLNNKQAGRLEAIARRPVADT